MDYSQLSVACDVAQTVMLVIILVRLVAGRITVTVAK